MKFRKKPVVIDAMKWTGTNWDEISAFCEYGITTIGDNHPLFISTLEGKVRCDVGDWLIRGLKGEFYPCKSDIFDATYEPVTNEQEGQCDSTT